MGQTAERIVPIRGVVFLNTTYICMTCDEEHQSAHGLIAIGIAACFRRCNEPWEKLSFREKQARIDQIRADKRFKG